MQAYRLHDSRLIITYDTDAVPELATEEGDFLTDLDEQHVTLPSESTYDPDYDRALTPFGTEQDCAPWSRY